MFNRHELRKKIAEELATMDVRDLPANTQAFTVKYLTGDKEFEKQVKDSFEDEDDLRDWIDAVCSASGRYVLNEAGDDLVIRR